MPRKFPPPAGPGGVTPKAIDAVTERIWRNVVRERLDDYAQKRIEPADLFPYTGRVIANGIREQRALEEEPFLSDVKRIIGAKAVILYRVAVAVDIKPSDGLAYDVYVNKKPPQSTGRRPRRNASATAF